MGVCVDFTLDHNLSDVSMAAVMQQFSALDSLFLEVARFWSQWYPQFGPPLEPWQNIGAFNRGEPHYRAPAGFTLWFGPKAVIIGHVCRFRHFAQEPSIRALLRKVTAGACKLLGADRVP